jgi:hypothetical protein
LTSDTFCAFRKCRYKAHLKIHGAAGEPSEYQKLQARLAAEYRLAAQQEMLRTRDPASVLISPPSLADALQRRPALILDTMVADADRLCRLDALERAPGGAYTPILFQHDQRITKDDRMRLAFGASVLSTVHGVKSDTGRIVHGPEFRAARVSLTTLAGPVQDTINRFKRCMMPPRPRHWC